MLPNAQLKTRVQVLFPTHMTHYGVGHTARNLSSGMNSDLVDCTIYCPSITKQVPTQNVSTLLSDIEKKLAYKVLGSETIRGIVERRFLKKLNKGSVVVLWPGCSLRLYQEVKRRGHTLVIELVNCHDGVGKEILDAESERTGILPGDPISMEKVIEKEKKLELCDFIYSPSPSVTNSLLSRDVSRERILEGRFGLLSSELVDLSHRPPIQTRKFRAIFVGRVGMRKGVHLLLEYWHEAAVDGELLIVGQLEEPVGGLIEAADDNVRYSGFASNMLDLMLHSDLFLFPSLEEGSPLVTYNALGVGLACIVSPMGGEGVVVDQVSGYVIPPHDKKSWVAAIRRLASDHCLRQKYSTAARAAAEQFTWDKVSNQRSGLLLNAVIESQRSA